MWGQYVLSQIKTMLEFTATFMNINVKNIITTFVCLFVCFAYYRNVGLTNLNKGGIYKSLTNLNKGGIYKSTLLLILFTSIYDC